MYLWLSGHRFVPSGLQLQHPCRIASGGSLCNSHNLGGDGQRINSGTCFLDRKSYSKTI